MVTLKQFREMTEDFPEDATIQIESVFEPGTSKYGPAFDIMTIRESNAIILLPQQVYINNGETVLAVEHKKTI